MVPVTPLYPIDQGTRQDGSLQAEQHALQRLSSGVLDASDQHAKSMQKGTIFSPTGPGPVFKPIYPVHP